MKKVQVNEVREKLAKYLSQAEQGEEIIITKHSKPIAKLMPVESKRSEFPDLSEFREKIAVRGKSMSEEVSEMRREERY